jgi:hypothetical protein
MGSSGGALKEQERLQRKAKSQRTPRGPQAEANAKGVLVKQDFTNAENRRLFVVLMKSMLSLMQGQRDQAGVLFDTYVMKANGDEAKAMAEQGKAYAERVTGKRDHYLGPPHTYIFGGLVTTLAARGENIGMKSAKEIKELIEDAAAKVQSGLAVTVESEAAIARVAQASSRTTQLMSDIAAASKDVATEIKKGR